MQSSHITAIIIVAIVMIASVLRAALGGGRHGRRGRHGRDEALPPRDDAETMRLREEVKSLKERLVVLERITVEKENSLAREIEQLRDEPRR
jgi:hypothetical protein